MPERARRAQQPRIPLGFHGRHGGLARLCPGPSSTSRRPRSQQRSRPSPSSQPPNLDLATTQYRAWLNGHAGLTLSDTQSYSSRRLRSYSVPFSPLGIKARGTHRRHARRSSPFARRSSSGIARARYGEHTSLGATFIPPPHHDDAVQRPPDVRARTRPRARGTARAAAPSAGTRSGTARRSASRSRSRCSPQLRVQSQHCSSR